MTIKHLKSIWPGGILFATCFLATLVGPGCQRVAHRDRAELVLSIECVTPMNRKFLVDGETVWVRQAEQHIMEAIDHDLYTKSSGCEIRLTIANRMNDDILLSDFDLRAHLLRDLRFVDIQGRQWRLYSTIHGEPHIVYKIPLAAADQRTWTATIGYCELLPTDAEFEPTPDKYPNWLTFSVVPTGWMDVRPVAKGIAHKPIRVHVGGTGRTAVSFSGCR